MYLKWFKVAGCEILSKDHKEFLYKKSVQSGIRRMSLLMRDHKKVGRKVYYDVNKN